MPNIHELTTRTVSMSRDQQIDHGFGICVKGGKDSGEFIARAQSYAIKTADQTISEVSNYRTIVSTQLCA